MQKQFAHGKSLLYATSLFSAGMVNKKLSCHD